MPSRIIRDGILTSERVNTLNWEAEVFYRRLMSVADDYGLYDARPAILRASLYPLQLDKMSECNIQRCLAACEKAGLILLYSQEGKSYLMIRSFNQQGKTLPKWPIPDGYEVQKSAEKKYELRKVVTTRDESLPNSYAYSKTNIHTKICTVEEVEAVLKNAVQAGRVRLLPDQIPDCAAAYWNGREAVGWNRRGVPVKQWQPDAIAFAVSFAANHPSDTGQDPYRNLPEL